MQIHHNPAQFQVRNAVLTIGTFDGVHQGHNKLLSTLKSRARELHGESVVMTFWPHPRLVLQPHDNSLSLLCSLQERIERLELTGIDHLLIYPFTLEFSQLSSCDFIEQVLVGQLGVRHLVVGHDHAFGRNREGNYAFLQSCAVNYHFSIEKVDAHAVDAINVSSTKIRAALEEGDIARANRYLNHPYSLSGTVVTGQRLGRTIGFPTLNLEVERYKLVPRDGVYAVRTHLAGQQYLGMLNIGVRPTIDDPRRTKTIEVHLLDYDGDAYGLQVQVYFVARLRDEQRFASVEALQAQLLRDRERVREMLG